MACELCGKEVSKNEIKTINAIDQGFTAELHVCASCASKLTHCHVCGTTIYWDKTQASEIYVNVDKPVCEECAGIHYEACVLCNKLERKTHVHTMNRVNSHRQQLDPIYEEITVCRTCVGTNSIQIVSCQHCGRSIMKESSYPIPNYDIPYQFGLTDRYEKLCIPCAQSIVTCETCGNRYISQGAPSTQTTRRMSMSFEGVVPPPRGGCRFCASLFRIHEYSYRPVPLFHNELSPAGATNSDKNQLHLGIELEIDSPKKPLDPDDAVKTIISAVGPKFVYAKRDGSLGSRGIELVTHPATIEIIESERDRYKKLCTIPQELSYQSHNAGTCGLHVHVSKGYLGCDTNLLENKAKIVWLVERFWPQLVIFSRRKGSDLKSWASRYLGPQDAKDILKIPKLKALGVAEEGNSRYKAVNLRPERTIEYRLFRGTLNTTTFFATLQLVHNLTSFAKQISITDLDRVEWEDIINFRIADELTAYNAQRVVPCKFGPNSVIVPRFDDAGFQELVDSFTVPDDFTHKTLGKTGVVAIPIIDNARLIASLSGAINSSGCWYVPDISWIEGGFLANDRFMLVNIRDPVIYLQHVEHRRFEKKVMTGYLIILASLLPSTQKPKFDVIETAIGLE